MIHRRCAPCLPKEVIIHSPVVQTPQAGRDEVFTYLDAASQVLGDETFSYVREIVDPSGTMLEFTCTVDDIHINGVDIIRWNQEGLVSDFKVMVRPIKAINMLCGKMAAMLAAQA